GAVSGGVTPFDQADSGLHGDTHLHGRVVTLRGKILTDNGEQQMDAFDELTSVFASSGRVDRTVDEPGRTMARMMTVGPTALAENGEQQMDAFDELTSVFASSRRVNLTVDEPERQMARMLTVAPTALPEPQPISDLVADVSVTVESDTYPLLDVSSQKVTITT